MPMPVDPSRLADALAQVSATCRKRFTRAVIAEATARRWLTNLMVVIGSLAAGIGSAVLFIVIGDVLDTSYHLNGPAIDATLLIAGIITTAACIFGLFRLRRAIRARRVRGILAAAGRCGSCDASLVGQPVAPDETTTCPACGREARTHRLLDELAEEPGGARTITAAKAKRRRRIAQAVYGSLATACVAALTYWTWDTQMQARQAAADRNPNILNEIQAKMQPAGIDASAPNAWDMVEDAENRLLLLEASARANPNMPASIAKPPPEPDYQVLFDLDTTWCASESSEVQAAEREMVRSIAHDLPTSGVLDALLHINHTQYALLDLFPHSGGPLVELLYPQVKQVRHLHRLNTLRMRLALEAHDRDRFVAAYESSLSLARVTRTIPNYIALLVSISIERSADNTLMRAINADVPDDWYAALEQASARQRCDIPVSYALAGDRAIALDAIACIFRDGANVQRLQAISALSSFGQEEAVGTYAQNKEATNHLYEVANRVVIQERFRRDRAEELYRPVNFRFAEVAIPGYGRTLTTLDCLELTRRGFQIMFALERFKHAQGRYPAALAELVPKYLSQIPPDVFSGQPPCYHTLDPAQDSAHRGYLLYSIGADGVDNQGREPDEAARRKSSYKLNRTSGLSLPAGAGYDYVINELD